MFLTRTRKQKLMVSCLKNAGSMIPVALPLPAVFEYAAEVLRGLRHKRKPAILETILPSPELYLAGELDRLSQHLLVGGTLSDALTRQNLLSEEIVQAVRRGESDGTLPRVMLELDGTNEEHFTDQVDAPIVKLVHGILIQAHKESVDVIAFPSLPDGQTTGPRPSQAGEGADGSFGGPVERDGNEQETGSDAALYFRKKGSWWQEMTLPSKITGMVMNRLLVMARLPYWSKLPQEGVIRMKVAGGALQEFKLHHDPAAPRVIVNV